MILKQPIFICEVLLHIDLQNKNSLKVTMTYKYILSKWQWWSLL